MQKIELQLAERLSLSIEFKNKKVSGETFQAYESYIESMKKYSLPFNERLFHSLKNKYERYKNE